MLLAPVVMVVAVVACHDLLTSPGAQGPSLMPIGSRRAMDDTIGLSNVPNEATYNRSVEPVFGEAEFGLVGVYNYPTIVQMEVSGDVQQVQGPGSFQNLRYGPLGNPSASNPLYDAKIYLLSSR